jgi:hypothetical protein
MVFASAFSSSAAYSAGPRRRTHGILICIIDTVDDVL